MGITKNNSTISLKKKSCDVENIVLSNKKINWRPEQNPSHFTSAFDFEIDRIEREKNDENFQ